MTACGSETPARAVYSLAHDLEHGLTESACARIFPAAALPRDVARSLDVASSTSSRSASASDSGRACEENIGAAGDVAIREFHDPKVHSVREIEIVRDGDVTAAARALVAFGDGDLSPVPLVEVDGRWRVVLLPRSG